MPSRRKVRASFGSRHIRSAMWRRGLAGSRASLVVALVLSAIRVFRRIASPKPTVLFRHKLAPGEVWQITARAAPPK